MSQAARRTGSPAQVIPESGESLVSVLADRVRRLLSVHSQTPITGLHPTIMREVERTLLSTVLDFTQGHREEASVILGLHRNSLRRRLRAVGLEDGPEPERIAPPARSKTATRTTAARSASKPAASARPGGTATSAKRPGAVKTKAKSATQGAARPSVAQQEGKVARSGAKAPARAATSRVPRDRDGSR